MKTQFISLISHEFRTPLSAIQTSFDVIEQMVKKEKFDNIEIFLKNIKQSIDTMTDLIENSVLLGSTDDMNLEVNITTIEFFPYLQSIIQSFESNERLILTYNSDKQTLLMTDVKLMRLILVNIISNALKYSKDEVNIKFDELEDNFLLQIVDKGKGIAKEEVEKIYEPFFKSKDSIAIEQGAGLGLTIVKQCADALNIKVSVQSEIGKGTAFKLRLLKKYEI
jgi:signal transduction histidine kinase